MTRTMLIAGLIAALFVTVGLPGGSIGPVQAAEMIQADMKMMKETGQDLMALKKEIAALQADLKRLTARLGNMSQMMDKAADDYCHTFGTRMRDDVAYRDLCP